MGGDQRQPSVVAAHSRSSRQRPCYLLSVQLLNTYKKINERFYEAKRKQQPGKGVFNDGYDDDQGNYVVQTGEEVAGRYIVQDVLGKGSFGVVVKAHDHRREESVALKIIKNKVQFYQQAKVEIDILTKLNAQAGDEHNIVKLKKVFSWKDHMCLVFELLSFNLYDLLKYTRFHGVSLNLIRKFAVQILRTLSFLAQQSVGIIHCDLKPENVLLRNPKRSAIKVIDFGSSCFVTKRMFKYIQSRFYRAPEVILGLGYDCAIDTWSLACMLVEMHTGQPLFDGKDEAEQLCKFQAILGPLPARMIEQSPKRNNFYQWDAKNKRWVLAPVGKDVSRYPRQRLEDIVNNGRRRDQNGHGAEDYTVFLDLITNMLRYNPKERIVPSDAMQHPFLGPVLQAAQAIQSQSSASVVSPRRPRCHSAAPTRSGSREPTSASRSHSRDQPPATARTRSRDRVGGSSTVSSTMDRKGSSSSVLAGTIGSGVDRHASLTNLSLGSALGKVGSHHSASLVGGIHAGATHGLPVGVQTAPVGSPLSPSALSLSTTSPRNMHGSLPQPPLFNAGAEPMSHAVLAERR